MTVPYMNPQTHRLTDGPGEQHPLKCRMCGRTKEECPIDRGPERWQECDHNDRPENCLIILCRVCSDKVIKPHPRLYINRANNDPWPGAMAICVDCKLRQGTACTAPEAKANGGPGVMLTVATPIHAMVDGTKYSGPLTIWPHAPTACKQRQVQSDEEAYIETLQPDYKKP
jgi:hypothetical protein